MWYMIYSNILLNVCAISTWNDGIHSKQVWVSGYTLPWNDGITPISVQIVNINIVLTSCSIALKMIWSATRYDL